MKKLLVTLAAVLVSVSSFAQGNFGTVTFHNRNFATPNADGQIHVPIGGVTDVASARAQLYLVENGNYTALTPLQTFRPSPNQTFFVGAVTVPVTGKAP